MSENMNNLHMELDELQIRIGKLTEFMWPVHPRETAFPRLSEYHQLLLTQQHKMMKVYANLLGTRIQHIECLQECCVEGGINSDLVGIKEMSVEEEIHVR